MLKSFALDALPWDRITATRSFITSLYTDPAPSRPGVLMHLRPTAEPAPAPVGLNALQQECWRQTEALRCRPIGGDDFVPTLGTGAGTCALATAFGCVEEQTGGVYWVRPCLTDYAQIDRLRKPDVRDGRLGGVLEQTRIFAETADPRVSIRVMDFQSPFTTCEQLLGSDLFFTIPYDDPRRLHALMDVVTDFSIEFFRAQMAAAGENCCPGIWPTFWFPRCAGIQMADDNMVNVSPEIYDEFVVPYNNRIAEAFGGLFLHSCTIQESNFASIRKIKRLTGINCDISSGAPFARLLTAFGRDVVVAPHCYINNGACFADYRAFMAEVLDVWRPGLRLFIHPCSVLYLPRETRDLPFDRAAVEGELAARGIRIGA